MREAARLAFEFGRRQRDRIPQAGVLRGDVLAVQAEGRSSKKGRLAMPLRRAIDIIVCHAGWKRTWSMRSPVRECVCSSG